MFVWPQRLPQAPPKENFSLLLQCIQSPHVQLECTVPWGAEVQHAPGTDLWFHFYFYSLESSLSWQMLPFMIMLKLIYIKMWMPCFYHILHQYDSVHFTKLYVYKSVTAKSSLKGTHLRELANRKFNKKQQIRGKISSKILQCKFTVTVSKKFWLLFQEKQLLTQLK